MKKLVGFYFASLVRSVSILFIPAVLLTTVVMHGFKPLNKKAWAEALYSCAASFGGFLTAAFIQYFQTGKWFYFLEVQKYWKRHWIFPKLPLSTYSPERIMAIDGIAVIIGVVAIYHCLKWTIGKVFKGRDVNTYQNGVTAQVVYSAFILAGTTLLDVFFTFNLEEGANIWSINRHLLCTPFAIVFLHWLYKHFAPQWREVSALVILLVLGIYLTGVFRYYEMVLYYFLFFFSFFIIKYYPHLRYYFIITYVWFAIVQITFFQEFLLNHWVG
ncbi:hypothetical protein GCM10023149_31190 [Mucilaginibacter gynuensis]|uniref:Uncharacterized protein n=2 Tax=Mucilaginibacter gynuensis TaxID=1302236 RepID=A0ABP8GNM8_9SPHI